MKKVYLYSDKNGEFLGEYNAHPDPETPGAYIEPICSTDVAPPASGDHQAAVFNDGVWTLAADYRGTVGYKEDGEPVEIAEIGDTLDSLGLRDAPPPQTPPTPSRCTRRQGRLALLANGLLDDVEALIAAIPDDTQRRAAQIEYEADTWERSNPTLQAMWAQLNGTPEGLDDLFALAVTK